MTANDPATQIHDFLISNYGHKLNGRELTPDLNVLDESIIDSMAVMELVSFIEDTFNVSVEDDEITPEHFGSLGSLTALVSGKL